MAKKDFSKVGKDTNRDMKQAALDLLSQQAKGEKRRYNKRVNKENRTELVQFRLTKTEYNKLISSAEQRSESISTYVRKLVLNELKG